MKTCEHLTPNGPCPQATYRRRALCSYHRKVEDGLIEPADAYMSDKQMRDVLAGRTRGDGRPADQWIVEGQFGLEPGHSAAG